MYVSLVHARLPGVTSRRAAQCHYGARAENATTILHCGVDPRDMPSECTHEAKWWRIPWSGERLWRAHPPIRGKQWAIPEEQWDRSQRRPRQPQGPWISHEMAAPPLELNKTVATKLVAGALRARLATLSESAASAPSQEQRPAPVTVRLELTRTVPLRGRGF